jgi:hypothetical protein
MVREIMMMVRLVRLIGLMVVMGVRVIRGRCGHFMQLVVLMSTMGVGNELIDVEEG